MLNGWEILILTETLIEKLDIYAKTCYRIMQGIKSKDYETNQSIYLLTGQVNIRESIRERQLKLLYPHADRHRFVIYESRNIFSKFFTKTIRTPQNLIVLHLLS